MSQLKIQISVTEYVLRIVDSVQNEEADPQTLTHTCMIINYIAHTIPDKLIMKNDYVVKRKYPPDTLIWQHLTLQVL